MCTCFFIEYFARSHAPFVTSKLPVVRDVSSFGTEIKDLLSFGFMDPPPQAHGFAL